MYHLLVSVALEPWHVSGRCVIAKALHVRPETVQHRRAGALHYVLTTMANRLSLLEQMLDVVMAVKRVSAEKVLMPEIAIRSR